jgi:hypothetical protein
MGRELVRGRGQGRGVEARVGVRAGQGPGHEGSAQVGAQGLVERQQAVVAGLPLSQRGQQVLQPP